MNNVKTAPVDFQIIKTYYRCIIKMYQILDCRHHTTVTTAHAIKRICDSCKVLSARLIIVHDCWHDKEVFRMYPVPY